MKRLILAVTMFLAAFTLWSSADAQPGPGVAAKNSQPLLRSAFRVDSKPEWSLDLRAVIPAGPIKIVGAARLKNGIVVAEGIAARLLYYSRDLRLARVVDLKSATRMNPRVHGLQRVNGDTLAILGTGQGWILQPSDTLASALRYAEVREIPSSHIDLLLAVLADGSSLWGVMDLSKQSHPSAKRFTDSLDLVVQSSGREIRKIARLPAMMLGTDSAGNSTQMWFYPHHVSASLHQTFYYGFGTDYVITRLNPMTGEEKSWRRAWIPHKVTRAEIDEFIEGWSVSWNRQADSIAVKRAMRNAPFAESVPAFSQFLVSPAQELWVRTPNLIDAQAAGELNQVPLRSSPWSVFDKGGRWLTEVTLPPGFQPTDIGSDYILGVQFGMRNGTLSGRERSLILYKYSRIFIANTAPNTR